MEIRLNDKRIIQGWAFFDWANSAFALVITVAVFPAYYINQSPETISILGMDITNSALFSYTISLAYLLIVIALPFLSGIADYSGRRKAFLRFFTWMGAIACMVLFLFTGAATLWLGLIAFMVAQIGFDGGKVFYNSYLPLISSRDQYDKVSAMGFAYGYVGSVILLIVNLLMIQFPAYFGLPEGDLPVRITFVMVGLWWIGFAWISFMRLPADHITPGSLETGLRNGIDRFISAWKELRPQKNTMRFLSAFFFYSAGVQTILYLAATFAEKELDFSTSGLILLILILQIVAIGGAWLFAWISRLRGNKLSLIVMLVIWMIICILAFWTRSTSQFYLIAVLVGLVMGGIQATSRAAYSRLLHSGDDSRLNSYYSFYEVLEKAAIVFGTFSFGLIDQLTGSMRNSILVLALYFLAGLIFLWKVRFDMPESGPEPTYET